MMYRDELRTVYYRSIETFEQEYQDDIHAEAEALIQSHLWWNQPLTLYDRIEYPLHLTGDSVIFHDTLNDDFGVRRVVDRKDDALLGLVDFQKIIEVLAVLCAEHAFSWELYTLNEIGHETLVGRITNGEPDDSLITYMTQQMLQFGISEADLGDRALHETIYSLYFDGDDEPIFDPLY